VRKGVLAMGVFPGAPPDIDRGQGETFIARPEMPWVCPAPCRRAAEERPAGPSTACAVMQAGRRAHPAKTVSTNCCGTNCPPQRFEPEAVLISDISGSRSPVRSFRHVTSGTVPLWTGLQPRALLAGGLIIIAGAYSCRWLF